MTDEQDDPWPELAKIIEDSIADLRDYHERARKPDMGSKLL